METVLRNACDACHKLKTKCPTEGTGACANCRRKGQICQFSPRSEMGRPRLTADKAAGQKQQSTNKRPLPEQKSPPNKRRTSSTVSIPPTQRASPPREETRQLHFEGTGNEAMPRQTAGDDIMEPLKLSDYLSTLEETCLYPVPSQTDFLMPDPSPLDLSWTNPAPPPYSSPMPISTMPDSMGLMASVPITFEDSSETSSSGNPSLQPDFAHYFGAGSYASNDFTISMPIGVDETQDNSNQDRDNALADGYSQLANVLFGLHNFNSYGEGGPAADLATRLSSLERAFPLVSTLCDILKRPQLSHGLATQKMLSSPCLLLASSVISTVVEIYHSKLGPFQSLDGDSSSFAELGTQQRLQLQTDAMVMEFHLTELRPIVKMACVAMNDSQTIDLMDAMRRTLREFLEDSSTLGL